MQQASPNPDPRGRFAIFRTPGRLIRAPWLDAPAMERRIDRQTSHWGQRFGFAAHILAAILFCGAVTGPIMSVETFVLPLLATFVLRLHVLWPLAWDALRQPLMLATLGWLAWCILSVSWSLDRDAALLTVSKGRWAYALLALWPMMKHRRLLIAGMLIGFAFGQVFQAIEALGLLLDIPSLTFDHPPTETPLARIAGYWNHPVHAGTMLSVALAMHACGVVYGLGRIRVIASLGWVLCAAGVLATGTRSAWLAGAVVTIFALVLYVVRERRRRERLRFLAIAAASAVLIAIPLWRTLGGQIGYRAFHAIRQIEDLIHGRPTNEDVAGRLHLAQWAVDAFLEHPVRGTGVGSFAAWSRDHAALAQESAPRIMGHAHNTLLDALATTGLIGAALLGLILTFGFVGALRGGPADESPLPARGLAAYDLAPAFGLLALCLCGIFDTIYANLATAALASALLGLCPLKRPTHAVYPWRLLN